MTISTRTKTTAVAGAGEIASSEAHPPHGVDEPIALPMSLRRLLVQQCDAETLRHLAWLKANGAPDLQVRRRLSEASLDELAEMLTSGRSPTIGWWRRAS